MAKTPQDTKVMKTVKAVTEFAIRNQSYELEILKTKMSELEALKASSDIEAAAIQSTKNIISEQISKIQIQINICREAIALSNKLNQQPSTSNSDLGRISHLVNQANKMQDTEIKQMCTDNGIDFEAFRGSIAHLKRYDIFTVNPSPQAPSADAVTIDDGLEDEIDFELPDSPRSSRASSVSSSTSAIHTELGVKPDAAKKNVTISLVDPYSTIQSRFERRSIPGANPVTSFFRLLGAGILRLSEYLSADPFGASSRDAMKQAKMTINEAIIAIDKGKMTPEKMGSIKASLAELGRGTSDANKQKLNEEIGMLNARILKHNDMQQPKPQDNAEAKSSAAPSRESVERRVRFSDDVADDHDDRPRPMEF